MGYVIAAYAVVLGALLLYGLRLAHQRRVIQERVRREADEHPA